jgi:hypothetical protein
MIGQDTILPMKVAGTQHLIERTYRESGAYQWVRETYINARQAGATRIEFGIEWQAVENLGVYRRTICDNGCGMSAEELVGFFNTFGGGGKPIGGAHENFGVGAKTSLFPWNKHGVVVVSWRDGIPAMIWVRQDPSTGEYGLRLFEAVDPDNDDISLEHVVEPFADLDDSGCDWNTVRPDWIGDHGTVIILLGNDEIENTVLGDAGRNERDLKGISSYLNKRIWEVGDDAEVYVEEFRVNERADWPRNFEEARGGQPATGPDRRTNRRRILGAKHYVVYPGPGRGSVSGEIAASGAVSLADGTEAEWYLWQGERPHIQGYAATSGYIAALYENELYDVTAHSATFRSFGVTEAEVRRNLWIVLKPPLLGDSGHGVYPRTDRNALLIKGGPAAGEPLPIADWGAEFADNMPAEILAAIRTARGGAEGTITDDAWRDRLAERFGSLWRLMRLRVRPTGTATVLPIQAGSTAVRGQRVVKARTRARSDTTEGGRTGSLNTGNYPGPAPASATKVAGGIPTYRTVKAVDLGEEAAMLAVWQKDDPEFPEGVVLLNIEHPMLEAEVHRWQSMYADHLAEQVATEVISVYGEIAVAKVAHSEHLKGHLPSIKIEQELRSPAALTMSLLGLVAEEAVISTRIGGKFGKRRAAA